MIIIDLWGFDHSGTLEGAGTIGGLLAMVRGWETWEEHSLVALDGLGNIIAYINPTNGTRQAEFEYGPFGDTVRTNAFGDPAEDITYLFAHRWQNKFSSAFFTTLSSPQAEYYDFGLRWYEPSLGRWLNRDPIGVAGGSNVYAYLGNNPFGGWDAWGLSGTNIWIRYGNGTWGAGYRDSNGQIWHTANVYNVGGGSTGGGGGADDDGEEPEDPGEEPDDPQEPPKPEPPVIQQRICYAYVWINPRTRQEGFFRLRDPHPSADRPSWDGLKVAVPPGYSIQAMVFRGQQERVWSPYAALLDWATLTSNDPKNVHHEVMYQHAANLAFGAMGATYGADPEVMAAVAGYFQKAPGTGRPSEWGEPFGFEPLPANVGLPGMVTHHLVYGVPPFYGNDPMDHNLSEDGYNAVRNGMIIGIRRIPCNEVGL
jgi:RHS repeat-associated protein